MPGDPVGVPLAQPRRDGGSDRSDEADQGGGEGPLSSRRGRQKVSTMFIRFYFIQCNSIAFISGHT